jgi:integrase
MASRKASLYIYAKTNSGWRYCPAVWYSNGTIKPHVCKTPDGERKFPGAIYYLYVAKKWEPVGSDPQEAVRMMEQRQGELLVAAATKTENEPLTLVKAFDLWIDDFRAAGSHQDTIDAKTCIRDQMTAHCKNVTMLSQITRQLCLTFIHECLIGLKNSDRTRSTKANSLCQFLRFHKITDAHGDQLIRKTDIPKYCEGDVLEFTADEMGRFWEACPAHGRLMCKMLLTCGLRRKEIESLRWVDIDFKSATLTIQPRPEYGFVPKKKHQRVVAIPDAVLAELKDSKEGSESLLCFPTRNGEPNTKVWEFVHRVCKKANIDAKKSHPHVFRSTYATTLLRNGMQVQDVAKLLGHNDISTTQRYMACLSQEELRQQVNQVQFAL